MYKYKMWDKKSNIDNINAKQFLEENPHLQNSDVFLVIKNGVIDQIQSVDVIRKNIYNSENMTSEEVAKFYTSNIELSLEDKISILEAEQEKQNEEILVNMLANTEMFEMILGMTPTTLSIEDKNTKNNGGNSMIEVYCTLIIKGVKTIEDVPLVIREQVIERLKQLEVPVK